jgi:hypothetical protein
MAKNKFEVGSSGFNVNNLSNVNKIPDANRALSGISPNSPKVNPVSNTEFFDGIGTRIKQIAGQNQDKNEYGKVFAYDNSPSGPTFRARYKAYGQETFNKIGFDPRIDNEAVYNQNTNTFDDMKRWATNAALPMVGLGFLSPVNSYASALGSGDIGASTQEAKDYEYYNALGYSSKGGLGGFTTNLLNSVSYSAGILLEGVAEGMAIGAGVGFVAGEGVGAIPGSIIGGAVKGIEAFTKIPKALYQSVASLGKINTAIKELKNINNAKNFFVTVGKGAGKFLNPLENTYDAYKSLKQVDDISRLAKTAKTAGAFWHDIMGMNMALSEGRLEGGFAEQNVYNKLYNDHYAKYSKAPSTEEQQKMMAQAKKAGFNNTMWNTNLVFYSNKIAFPSITRAGFLKGAPRFNFGRVVGEVGKEFQLIFNPADDVAKSYYSKEAISLKNSLKALKNPKKLGAGALNYFKKNLVEGFQEVSQEALAAANEKYYTDTFYNPAARGYMYGFGAIADGFNKQMSEQGAEVFGSGFLMGSLLEGPSKLFKFGTKNFSRLYTDKAVYEQNLKERGAQADNIVNALNNMHQNAKHFFDPRMSNYSTQMLLAKTVDNPDKASTKEIKDLEFAAFQSSVLTSLRTGTFDMFVKNLGEYKSLSSEELEEAWSLEPGQGEKALQNIDTAIASAKVTEARFNYAKDKFKDFIDLNNYKEGSPEHQAATIYNQAYLESINSFVFLQNSFDNGLKRMQKLYGTASKIKALAGSPFANFSILSDSDKLSAQINYLMEEIDSAISVGDPKLAEEVRRKRTLLNALNEFHTSQENITGQSLIEVLNNLQEDGTISDPRLNDYLGSFEKVLEAIAINNKEDGAFEDRDIVKANLRAELDNDGGTQNLFNSLFDIHLLRHENASIAKYVNMLADPQGFYDHINKNFEWMKNMYNNRKEYYKEIVNKEITDVEKNEVLNALASKGIFVDLDEFAEWCNNPDYMPSYFIDTTKEMIINQDSILYPDYARIFTDASNVLKTNPAGDPATLQQQYDDRLEELKKQKSEEVNKSNEDFEQAFQDETGVSLQDAYSKNQEAYDANEKLEKDKKEAEVKVTKLQNLLELIGKDPVDSVEIVKLTEELLTPEEIAVVGEEMDEALVDAIMDRNFKKADQETMYKAVDIIYALTEKSPLLLAQKIEEQNNILKQEPIEIIDIAETKAYKVNQERLDAINQRYDKFEAALENEFKERGIDSVTPEDFTAQMGYDAYPQDLQAQIDEKFNEYLRTEGIDPESLSELEYTKYFNYRQNWLESEAGSTLLNEYNQKIREEGAARAKALKEPPVLTSRVFKNLKIEATIPIGNLNAIIDKLETAVKNKIYKVGDKEIKLSEQDIKEISEDIDKLRTFLKYRQGASQPVSIQAQVLDSFRKGVAARQDELVDVFDEDGNKIGRKFADDPDNKLTRRVTNISDQLANEITGETAFSYSDENIEKLSKAFFFEYNNAVKKGDADAFDKAWAVFTELVRTNNKQFNNEEKKARIRKSLEQNTTEENFKKLMKAEAYSNNAKAGTRVDATIRKFFTIDAATSTWAELKYSDTVDVDGTEMKISDIMSESAFEDLFGVRGIVSRFRADLDAKGYIPLTNNVKLFDRNLLENGVSGETDIVLINTKGEIMIVDIKTATSWNGFQKPDSWKNVAYRAQLSIYRNLYHNMTGVIPKIALFPIRVKFDKQASAFISEVSVGGEKDKTGPLVPLVPNTAKLFNTLELEYLPEVETQGGITLNKPAEIISEENPSEKTGEAAKKSSQLTASDTSKVLLKDNLGKQVIYNGKIGTLILQDDGTYAVEVDLSNEAEFSNELLSRLKEDLAFENGEFGDPETAKQIQTQIDDIEKNQKGKEIYPVQSENKNISDGTIELTKAGLSLITPIQSIGQVSMINGEVFDARFENDNEDVAIVNGVRYTVGRNNLGEIVQLVYFKNDKRRAEIDNLIIALTNKVNAEKQRMQSSKSEIESLNEEILNLEKQKRNKDANFADISKKIKTLQQKIQSLSPQSFVKRIAKAQDKINELQNERDRLSADDKVFVLGGNTNDVIFALNRLPNQFQKNRAAKSALDTQRELKQIAALSPASPRVEKEIDGILDRDFPEELNVLFAKGISEFKGRGKELAKIKNWIDIKIIELKVLERSLRLDGDTLGADSVNRQISALNELLNQLNLINLTAKNRIAKEQPYEQELNQIFGPESEVQSGTSVPEIQSPTGGQTENVPGETGRGETQEISISELQKIVKSSTDELDNLVPEEFIVNKATEAFAEITDLEALQLKKIELLKNKKSNKLTTAEINTAYENRKLELIKNVDIASLKVGDILQDISNFTNQDSPVQVAKINKNSVILKYGDVTQEVTEDELVNNFVKPTNESTMEEVVKPSQETVDASEQTKTDASENLSKKEFLDRSEKEADESSEDDLFKNLEDNSKTC